MTWKLIRNTFLKEFPVRTSPSVDTLLDVPYDEIVPALGFAFFEKGAEILPLYPSRILKLVKKIMVITDADLFIYERCIGTVDDITKNSV
jgi:hypothetical protein